MVKVYLALTYLIKNQSIGVAQGALHDVFWSLDYLIAGPFYGSFSADFQ